MLPHTIDQVAFDDLKQQASARAEDLGHQLGPFRTAKHDPLCSVSFCLDCRQMVIISLEKSGGDRDGALYGYALEAPCAGDHARAAVSAGVHE